MSAEVLSVSLRSQESFGKGSARRARREGKIPGVAYAKNKENIHFEVKTLSLTKILDTHGRNALIKLDSGNNEEHFVMLKDFQRHPVSRQPLHVDFQVVELDKEVRAKVNVAYQGRPVGVQMGGKLNIARRYIYLSALPTDVPQVVDIDISKVEGGSTLYTGDIEVPEKTTLVDTKRVPLISIRGGVVK